MELFHQVTISASAEGSRWFQGKAQRIITSTKIEQEVCLQALLHEKWELPDVQLEFEKEKEQKFKLPTSPGSLKKQENSRKISTSASLTTIKPLPVWITRNCIKFLKRREYHITLPVSWEDCMQDKKQQLEPDIDQWTGSKLGKEYIKAMYCHPAYLTSMQSTSCEILS